jgi:GGDEF domain-containing protein
MFVNAHRQLSVPCSLIICDLDHFKQINDQFGHQAGDEVIKTLASLLRHSCRPGDFAARYGGEEFVMLCADCNANAATRRAEQLRIALGQAAIGQLKDRRVTATGVTNPTRRHPPPCCGDPTRVARGRCAGRNAVAQLGVGFDDEPIRRLPWRRSLISSRRDCSRRALAGHRKTRLVADTGADTDVEDTSVFGDRRHLSGVGASGPPATFIMRRSCLTNRRPENARRLPTGREATPKAESRRRPNASAMRSPPPHPRSPSR